jgi:predicted nucleic acid-binding protein
MAASVVVDTGFLVSLLSRRDAHHRWAAAQAARFPPPWQTCEAVTSEAFHLLGRIGDQQLGELFHRRAVVLTFSLAAEVDAVLALMRKYASVPMSLADACLVRMTEIVPTPMLLTTDADFRVYRRHSRQSIPSQIP